MPKFVKPTLDRVLLEVQPKDEQTPGGIILPGATKGRADIGVVLAVGPGTVTSGGHHRPVGVEVGQRVRFDPYQVLLVSDESGFDTTMNAIASPGAYALVSESSIHYVVEGA